MQALSGGRIIVVLAILSTAGCSTGVMWQNVNTPLYLLGFDSRIRVEDGQRSFAAWYAPLDGKPKSPKWEMLIHLKFDGSALPPFQQTATLAAQKVNAAAIDRLPLVRVGDSSNSRSASDYWPNGELLAIGYRIDQLDEISIKTITPDLTRRLVAHAPSDDGERIVVLPQTKSRPIGDQILEITRGVFTTPFTAAADVAMAITAPVWVPILIANYKE